MFVFLLTFPGSQLKKWKAMSGCCTAFFFPCSLVVPADPYALAVPAANNLIEYNFRHFLKFSLSDDVRLGL